MENNFYDDHEAKYLDWEHQMIHEYGWYAHFVFEDSDFPNSINFHTHGLEKTFNHPDLQICLPLDKDVAHGIFVAMVNIIKDGGVFKEGSKYDEIIDGGFSVELIEAVECGRKVLRVVFPDQNGTYAGRIYAAQFDQKNT